jgi:transposase-like protein
MNHASPLEPNTITAPASGTPRPADRARSRRRWNAEQKAELLAAFAASGVTATRFCRDRGVHPATLSGWQRQAVARDEATGQGPSFAEVCVARSAASAAAIIHLPGGARLEVPPGTSPAWLGAVLTMVAAL